VESETFADAHYCYVLQESAIVFLMMVVLVLRQKEELSLVVAMVLAFSLKMNAGHPLFDLEEPSC
jgi:hypothetical protein